jgi:hypothetical protein
VLGWQESGCGVHEDGGPDFAIAPMPIVSCVWFEVSVGSLSFFNGMNSFPEFYAVGPASGPRGQFVSQLSGARGCGFLGQASHSTNPTLPYQDSGVCNQPADMAGVTFSGCLDYVTWVGHCIGWVAFINCQQDAFNEQACEDDDKTPTDWGNGSGSVSGWSRSESELKKRNNETSPAAYIFNLVDKVRTPESCQGEYSDIMVVKNHPKAGEQYCNGTAHVTVLDQGTVITRYRDPDCVTGKLKLVTLPS